MKKNMRVRAISLLAAAAISSGALAQEIGDVTVQASRIEKSQIGRTASGIPLLAVSVTHVVSAADLDLQTSDGMAELQARVEMAAELGCRDISLVYRDAKPDDRTCARLATGETMARVRELIAAN